jgi:hypothetical protein
MEQAVRQKVYTLALSHSPAKALIEVLGTAYVPGQSPGPRFEKGCETGRA